MSYVSQQFLPQDDSTVANFKAWGSALSAAIASMGWTQTSDTGQVNWTTIAAVGQVYEVWQPSADPLQTGSTQYFLKLFYNANSNHNSIGIQLGFATNGSGGFVGASTGLIASGGFANPGTGTTLYECNFSGDVNRIGVMMWRNGSSVGASQIFGIERTKNTDGTDSTDGVQIYYNDSQQNGGQIALVFSGQQVTSFMQNGPLTGRFVCVYTGASDLAFNNNIPVLPVFPVYGKVGNPSTELCGVPSGDIAEGAIFSTTLYGATRTYLASGHNGSGGWGANSMKVAMRYD